MSAAEGINHGYAEYLAAQLRFRVEAAREALECLDKALGEAEKGPVAGVIPNEVLATYLYTGCGDMPLSVTPDSGELLVAMAENARDRLASVTETLRMPTD